MVTLKCTNKLYVYALTTSVPLLVAHPWANLQSIAHVTLTLTAPSFQSIMFCRFIYVLGFILRLCLVLYLCAYQISTSCISPIHIIINYFLINYFLELIHYLQLQSTLIIIGRWWITNYCSMLWYPLVIIIIYH